MLPWIKELTTSKNRVERLLGISYMKELGLLGVRIYNLTKSQEDLETLNNLSLKIKHYEKLEKTIHREME